MLQPKDTDWLNGYKKRPMYVYIYGSLFCIHSSSLCCLAGTFNRFTFKVIIDIYVPIAIFLIVWGLFLSLQMVITIMKLKDT